MSRNHDNEDLTAHFKSAALSLTHIYKKANQDRTRYHNLGYAECLNDVYQYAQSNTTSSNTLATLGLVDFLKTRSENLDMILDVGRCDAPVEAQVDKIVESVCESAKRGWTGEEADINKKQRL